MEETIEKTRETRWKVIRGMIDEMFKETYDNWWTAVRPDIPDLIEFKKQFKEKYWLESTQNRIQMNLSNGKYNASKGQSPTSYFLGKICLARKLTPQIPEECLVEQLSKHYNKEIENSSRYNQFKKIQNLASLLETCEQTGQYRDYQAVKYKSDSYNNNNGQNNNCLLYTSRCV